MILDHLDHADRYLALNRGFAPAFEFLRSAPLGELAPGRHEIDGDRVFLLLGHDAGRGRAGAKLEAHRRYIDIQLLVSGREEFGWSPIEQCRNIDMPYDPTRDIAFWTDPPILWCPLPSGMFAIFMPHDAHAPLAGEGAVIKAVCKVAVDA